ncbi:MAG: fibronectin type III domain-containing protein [Candidatus Ventricola sp.]
MKKYLSLFLVLVMLMSSMPLNVFAEGGDAQSDEGSVSVAAAAEESAEDAKKDTKEEPVKQEPKQEEPAKEEPKQEEPAKEEPKQEEPAKEEPKQEEPVKDEPADEQPVDEKPADGQPADEQPADEKPADEQPADEKPADEQPVDEKPADEKPADEKPADEQPADEQPVDEQPADEQPADGQPADGQPAEGQPADEQPAEGEPAEGEQGVENPELPADGLIQEIPGFPGDGMMEFAPPMQQIQGFSLKEQTNETVTLTWKATDADEGYLIEYGYGDNPFTSSTSDSEKVAAGETSVTIKDLEIGRTYSFRIRARYSDGSGGINLSLPSDDIVKAQMCPYPPEDLDIEMIATTNAKLTWSAPEKGTGFVTGYYVVRENPDGSTTDEYVKGADKTEYLSKYLTVGGTYTFRVFTYYIAPKTTTEVLSKESISKTITVKLPAPQNPEAVAISLREIRVTWDDVSGADGYEVWRRRGGVGEYAMIGEVKSADKPSFLDNATDIYPGFEYWYYIKPFCDESWRDDEGISYSSRIYGERTGEFSAIVYPPAPTTIKAVYQSDSQIEVTWSAVTDIEGYILEGSDDNETFKPIELKNPRATSYLETGLAVGQTRYYRVKSYVKLASGNIESENWSAIASDAPRPLAPENLELTNPSAYDQIMLKWDASEGADGYEILRSTSSKTTPTEVVYDTAATEWTDKNLTCGKDYFYRVRAYVYDTKDVKRVGAPTETKSLKARPAPPEILSATQVSETNTALLTWTKIDGAKGYYIYAKQDGGSAKKLYTVTGTLDDVQQKTITGLSLGSDYSFYVMAYRNVSGKAVVGDKSESVDLEMAFYPPKDVKFSVASSSSVKLSWEKMSGITGYEVTVTCKDDPSYNLVKKTTSTSMTLTKLSTRYTYEATVRAYRKASTYLYGDPTTPVTFYTSPDAPTKLVLKTVQNRDSGDMGISLSWKGVSNCDGYLIERATAKDGPYTVIHRRESADNLTYVDEGGLTIGEKYYYRVRAFAEGNFDETEYGNLHASSPATNYLTLPPAQVEDLEAEGAGTTQVNLSWKETPGADGYYVYRKTGSGDYVRLPSDSITLDGDTLRYTVDNLKAGTQYTFRVRAYVGSAPITYGAYSSTVSIRPAPLAPENVVITEVGAKRAKLTWDGAEGATSYKIYSLQSDGSTKYHMTVKSKSSTVTTTVKGLAYDTEYQFVVHACAGGATGPQSEPSNKMTTELGVPSVTASAVSSTSLKLSWGSIPDASGYEVQKRSDGSEWQTVASTTSTSYTVKSLTLGQSYDFRVRAYVKSGSERLYRDDEGWDTLNEVYSLPSVPSSFKVRGWGKDYIRMSWTAIKNADGYNIYYRELGDSDWSVKSVNGDLETGTITQTIGGLKSYTYYEYYVRAYIRTDGGTIKTGAKTKTLKTRTSSK